MKAVDHIHGFLIIKIESILAKFVYTNGKYYPLCQYVTFVIFAFFLKRHTITDLSETNNKLYDIENKYVTIIKI